MIIQNIMNDFLWYANFFVQIPKHCPVFSSFHLFLYSCFFPFFLLISIHFWQLAEVMPWERIIYWFHISYSILLFLFYFLLNSKYLWQLVQVRLWERVNTFTCFQYSATAEKPFWDFYNSGNCLRNSALNIIVVLLNNLL